VRWKLVFTKQAQKDAKKLSESGLKKSSEIIQHTKRKSISKSATI
jgi:mRNA-degrading endonuclease RelE of RelBE toxin-antitoxin system